MNRFKNYFTCNEIFVYWLILFNNPNGLTDFRYSFSLRYTEKEFFVFSIFAGQEQA